MPYSIWIIPPDPLYTQLKSVIIELSKKYKAPIFEPHLTLLGRIDKELPEIEQGLKKLVNNLNKLEMSLGHISFSTTYFQSVFVRVDSTAKLMQLNLDAKILFDKDNVIFMPHISLLYGNHDMTTREKVASEINLPAASFIINELVITPATNDPSEWKHLATIPFQAARG